MNSNKKIILIVAVIAELSATIVFAGRFDTPPMPPPQARSGTTKMPPRPKPIEPKDIPTPMLFRGVRTAEDRERLMPILESSEARARDAMQEFGRCAIVQKRISVSDQAHCLKLASRLAQKYPAHQKEYERIQKRANPKVLKAFNELHFK